MFLKPKERVQSSLEQKQSSRRMLRIADLIGLYGSKYPKEADYIILWFWMWVPLLQNMLRYFGTLYMNAYFAKYGRNRRVVAEIMYWLVIKTVKTKLPN